MALVSMDLQWEEEARLSQTAREWRQLYKAFCSDIRDGAKEILLGAPRLAPLQPHPKDAAALVEEFWPRRIDATTFFDVQVRYSTEVQVPTSPLAVPPLVTIDSQIREVPAIFDVDGNPICNAAGDLFTDPPATRKIVDQVIKFQRNIGLILPQWVQTHPGTVNNDSVRIRGLTYDAGTLFCAGIAVGEENNIPGATESFSTLRGVPYTQAGGELWYRKQGWTEIYPNRGFFGLFPIQTLSQKQQAILSDTSGSGQTRAQKLRIRFPKFKYERRRITVGPLGDFPPEPVFLDINGAPIVNPTFADMILLEYDVHDKQPFSLLQLR